MSTGPIDFGSNAFRAGAFDSGDPRAAEEHLRLVQEVSPTSDALQGPIVREPAPTQPRTTQPTITQPTRQPLLRNG